VALARALVAQPDVLMLDEPTNHLDTDSVEWITEFLASYPGALLVVTHDRHFLDQVANGLAVRMAVLWLVCGPRGDASTTTNGGDGRGI
jgi:ABC-type lipoprotein export system ATPase subunit